MSINTASKIKVLITDDSFVARELLRELLESDPEIEVVGFAENGKQAIEQVLSLKPDVVTMDLEMPVMGGHEAIERIMALQAVPILVISSLDDAQNAYRAVSHGALEAMGKPQLEALDIEEFTQKVKMLSQIKVIKHLRPISSNSLDNPTASYADLNLSNDLIHKEIFAIASSTGGPHALESIIKALPNDFPCPIVIAQHICKGFTEGMAEWLNNNVPLEVKVAREAERLQPAQVYISPAEHHMRIAPNRCVTFNSSAENSIYHPSCDVLLKSVANTYGNKSVGIICTGMGNDGVAGMQEIHAEGGTTLAQDEHTSVIFGMNQIAISQKCIDQVLSLDAIPGKMLSLSGYKAS